VAREIPVNLDTTGNQNLVFLPYAHEPFVEGPVAKTAQGQAVCWPVVVALYPGDDVGSLDHRVAVRR